MQTDATQTTKRTRRNFLISAGVGLGALRLANQVGLAAEKPPATFAKPAKIRLGTVTYNLAKDWDLPTIIRNCAAAKFEGVELRTSHTHGVEVTLTKTQRQEVAKQFRDSPVA